MTNIDPAIVEAVARLAEKPCEFYDEPGQDCITAGTAVFEAEACAPCAIRAAVDAARAEVLPREVERGVVCFHGTPKACLSLRCGSNCSHRFDRMHPCPACLIAERDAARAEGEKQGAARVREAVEAIHRPESDDGTTPFCRGCWEAGGYDGAPTWPCDTIRALHQAAPRD